MRRHTVIQEDEACPAGPEPMHKPDHKAKKHSRPRVDRARHKVKHRPRRAVLFDPDMVVVEMSRLQRELAGGAA